jgi:VRR-NUC domain
VKTFHVSEKLFTQQVIDLARWHQWRLCHFRAGINRRGQWQTAIQGDRGFPDLVLVRRDKLIFAELKTHSGRITSEQDQWLSDLKRAGCMAIIWRPNQFEQIEEQLK